MKDQVKTHMGERAMCMEKKDQRPFKNKEKDMGQVKTPQN